MVNNVCSCSAEEILAVLSANFDDVFLIIMGSLILLMQAGFAFLEAGSVRAKNTTNILIKNFSDLCLGKIFANIQYLIRKVDYFLYVLGGLSFWSVGYSLAFGKGNSFIGYTHFMSIGLPYSEYSNVFFQVGVFK